MPQKTDLNVAPYYDDFDPNDKFNRVLFRPGFAVQARELTTLQSILQNQVERMVDTSSKKVQWSCLDRYLLPTNIMQ